MKLDLKRGPDRAFLVSIGFSAAFVALIYILDPLLDSVIKPADQGSWWYYWRLSLPTWLTALSVWVPYAIHQAAILIVAFLMMREKAHPDKLSRLNYWMLGINASFSLLHLLQTHLFYDGLAQYVPVWSSQYSVIVMLVLILYIQAPKRGLILGWKPKFSQNALKLATDFHGPYIAWALCYTFWFHPTEGDYGLLTGFFYMSMLFVQLSLANTRIHFNKGWIVALELLVAVHGPAIALQKSLDPTFGEPSSIWIMFLSGFLFMFVFTGQFAFKWPVLARAAAFAAYAALVIGLYWFRGFGRIYEILFIPVALYGGAIAAALAARLLTWRAKPQSQAA
jgi:hypothetical protein